MDPRARNALAVIHECVAADRLIVLPHFTQRMDQRGLFWADVLAVIDHPGGVRYDGPDNLDRPKWIVSGSAADGLAIEIVCVLEVNESGDLTVFITMY